MYIFLLPCNNKLKSELTEEDRHDASLEEDDLAVSTGRAADGFGGVNSPAAWWGKLFIARAGSSRAVAEEGSSLFIFPGELRPGFGPFGVPGCRVLWPPAALEEGGGG